MYHSQTRSITSIISIALIGTLTAALAGCDSSGSSNPTRNPISVAYANITASVDTFKAVSGAIAAGGDTLGWTVETYDNNFEGATAVANARLMAAGEADVVISWVPDPSVVGSVAQIFADAGKPCLSVNVAIDGCPLLNIDNSLYGQGSGKNLAAAATEKGWTADDTIFVSIGYAAGGQNPLTLVSSAAQSFSESFPGFDSISADEVKLDTTTIGDHFIQVDGAGTLADTNTALRDALQNIPDGTHLAIVTANDDAGLGALAALDSAGRSDEAIIASTGSSADALENLRNNPVWVSEGAVYFDYWAAYMLAMSQALIEGAELPDLTVAPQNNLTKSNVDEYFDGSTAIKAPPMDPSAEYLVGTGVLEELGISG